MSRSTVVGLACKRGAPVCESYAPAAARFDPTLSAICMNDNVVSCSHRLSIFQPRMMSALGLPLPKTHVTIFPQLSASR